MLLHALFRSLYALFLVHPLELTFWAAMQFPSVGELTSYGIFIFISFVHSQHLTPPFVFLQWVSLFCWILIIIIIIVIIVITPLPPIDTIWAMMIVWRTRGDYRTARAVLEAIIAFSAMHTYYEQLPQVKQICLCLTGFTSLCLDACVFLCFLVFHCMHVVLL